jgi:ABC-type Mn2+/Zn2+ transport system ATPase subunit
VVARVLESLRRQGKTFLVATHDLGRLETDFDQALYLSGGRAVPAPPGALAIQALGQEAVWTGS